jgi:hypothetical protein
VNAPARDPRQKVNNNRRQLFAASDAIAFICECAHRDCYTTVALTAAQFDLARQAPPHLVLAPGHLAEALPPSIETVIPANEAASPQPDPPPA